MIPSLLHPLSDQNESSADIFNSALSTLFPDDSATSHGDPDSVVVYRSTRFGDIELHLSKPTGSEGDLFAHYVWNSGIILCELIGGLQVNISSICKYAATEQVIEQNVRSQGDAHALWIKDWAATIKDKKVLELGSGSGVASIISHRAGAGQVTCTDYPGQDILSTIRGNLVRNLVSIDHSKADQDLDADCLLSEHNIYIHGHKWGDMADDFSRTGKNSFDIVIACDTLWLGAQHENLLASFEHFLSNEDPKAEGWIIAGFHTGRARVARFVDLVEQQTGAIYTGGLRIDQIGEIDINMNIREWAAERSEETITDRKRWCVLIILKRR